MGISLSASVSLLVICCGGGGAILAISTVRFEQGNVVDHLSASEREVSRPATVVGVAAAPAAVSAPEAWSSGGSLKRREKGWCKIIRWNVFPPCARLEFDGPFWKMAALE